MFLKYITIQNFRGIEKLEKFEVANLNTYVGKNDAGKSIILRALDYFFNDRKFDIKDIFKGKKEGESTIIELSFDPIIEIDDLALDSTGLLTIKKEFILEKVKIKQLATCYLSNDFTQEIHQDLWNKKEQDLNEIIKNLGAEPKKSGRGKKNVLRIEQIKEILSNEERTNTYHDLGDFLKNLQKTYSISLPDYSLFGAEHDLDVGATTFQSQFKPIISAYFENAKTKTEALEEELKGDLAVEFEEIRKFMSKNVSGLKKLNPTAEFDWSKSIKKFDLNLEFEDEDYDVPISHKGTGFKRLLMVAYFEYLASKKTVSNQIFAIEEPETYLHPSAQQDLLESIIKITGSSQFFLSTHSPVFAGETNGDNSILVTKNEKGISLYSRGEEIIPRIIEELGIKPDYNLLENTKFMIFVEGKDDVHFLNIAARMILDKNFENDRILCVIGGGGSLKNYADLDLFKKLKGNNLYSVFVDGDDQAHGKEKWIKKIKDKCESDGADFKKLSKREIENYCHLSAICRKCSDLTFENINIENDTDVQKHLKELGLVRNFKNGLNVEVFEEMTKEEWVQVDNDSEIKSFIEGVYSKI